MYFLLFQYWEERFFINRHTLNKFKNLKQISLLIFTTHQTWKWTSGSNDHFNNEKTGGEQVSTLFTNPVINHNISSLNDSLSLLPHPPIPLLVGLSPKSYDTMMHFYWTTSLPTLPTISHMAPCSSQSKQQQFCFCVFFCLFCSVCFLFCFVFCKTDGYSSSYFLYYIY